jgi:hypothetical protein
VIKIDLQSKKVVALKKRERVARGRTRLPYQIPTKCMMLYQHLLPTTDKSLTLKFDEPRVSPY